MTGPSDSVAPHQSPKQSSLFTGDWRSGHRFALFWLALVLCLLSLVALAVVFFGWGDTNDLWRLHGRPLLCRSRSDHLCHHESPALAGLQTRYVLTFTVLCLVGLTAFISYVLVERAL